MNGIYRTSRRIRVDLQEFTPVVERTGRIWQQALAATDDYYVDATALNLHGFYAGLERLLEIIADGVEQAKPAGARRHDDLLRQMAARGSRRPAAGFEPGAGERLDRYRRSRHVVRNVYTYNSKGNRSACWSNNWLRRSHASRRIWPRLLISWSRWTRAVPTASAIAPARPARDSAAWLCWRAG